MVTYNLDKKKIWVAGHTGMVGRALVKKLLKKNCNVITANKEELNLINQIDTRNWIKKNKPDVIYMAAAKVGGIKANMLNKSSFLYENLMIQNNVLKAANDFDIEKVIFLGSSCIYPKVTKQPMKEEELLNGKLEETNEGYALAKIAGLKLCEYFNKENNKNFISLMPSNLYGPFDNFDLESSHVLSALIRKIFLAKMNNIKHIEVWGTGKARREFLYVDDFADAAYFLTRNYHHSSPINVGSFEEVSIAELVDLISDALNYKVQIRYNKTMPDGTLLKKLDLSKISSLGWKPITSLKEGIKRTLDFFESKIISREKK